MVRYGMVVVVWLQEGSKGCVPDFSSACPIRSLFPVPGQGAPLRPLRDVQTPPPPIALPTLLPNGNSVVFVSVFLCRSPRSLPRVVLRSFYPFDGPRVKFDQVRDDEPFDLRCPGTSNCSWTSCREGCTKELYDCTQIRVNYKLPTNLSNETQDENENEDEDGDEGGGAVGGVGDDEEGSPRGPKKLARYERALRQYDYVEEFDEDFAEEDESGLPKLFPTGLMGNDSEWYFTGAKLFPNVKGCGYPPLLNCSIFYRQYANIGHNFSCYYSKVDPGIVISDLDMWQVYMNLVYAMAIPIPSFIISVIYLTIAYFKIYNEDEEVLVAAEETADGVEGDGSNGTPLPQTSGALTPGSEVFREDLASFGHQYKIAMADDISREGLDGIPNSSSVQGNLSKTMTTSISTPPGPTAAV